MNVIFDVKWFSHPGFYNNRQLLQVLKIPLLLPPSSPPSLSSSSASLSSWPLKSLIKNSAENTDWCIKRERVLRQEVRRETTRLTWSCWPTSQRRGGDKCIVSFFEMKNVIHPWITPSLPNYRCESTLRHLSNPKIIIKEGSKRFFCQYRSVCFEIVGFFSLDGVGPAVSPCY